MGVRVDGPLGRGLLVASGWYLVAFPLLTVLTKILRFVETLQRVSTKRSWPEENDGEFHWYTYPRTPFCHYVAFPLKGKREIQRGLPIVG